VTFAEHLNPFHVRRVALETALPPAECTGRLRADLAPFWVFWPAKQQLKGRVGEESFTVRRHTGARRSMPSEARGSLAVGGRGTHIECSIGWRLWDRLGLLVLLPVVLLTAFLAKSGLGAWEGLWLPLLFLGVATFAVVINRAVTLHDDDWLVAHLCALLEAQEIPTSTF
jgi:hypothetical protein